MSNIKLVYLYRDGSNFKKHGQVVFANPANLTAEEVTSVLRHEWGEDAIFLAHQVRLPEVFLYGKGDADADDHCFHELDRVESTDQTPNDKHGRSITDFIAEIQSEEGRRWTVFDPFDRWFRV